MGNTFAAATHRIIRKHGGDLYGVPIASHLNHDGKPNGIVWVQVLDDRPGSRRRVGPLLDVGACALEPIE